MKIELKEIPPKPSHSVRLVDSDHPHGTDKNLAPPVHHSHSYSLHQSASPDHSSRLLSTLGAFSPPLHRFEEDLHNLPANTDWIIVFPWDDSLQDFTVEDYHRLLTIEHITQEDVETVFAQLASSPFHNPYGDLPTKFSIAFLGLLCVLGILLYFNQATLSMGRAMISLLLALGLLLALVCLFTMYSNQYLAARLDAREKTFTEILDTLNKDKFAQKDVQWKCGHFGTFIELDLNYKMRRLSLRKQKQAEAAKTSQV